MTRHLITIDGHEERFACGEEFNVLAAMERARCGAIPVGCRNGGCGACKVRVLAGHFHAAKMNRAVVSEADQHAGCVLACKIFPRSDLSLQVLGRAWTPTRPVRNESLRFGLNASSSDSQPDKEK